MIKERYCSYEVAKLLKEKGFDELTTFVWYEHLPKENAAHKSDVGKQKMDYFYYDKDSEHNLKFSNGYIPPYINGEVYSAPTHQMACDWLAEKFRLFFQVGFGNDIEGNFLYMVDIYDLSDSAVYGKYKPIVEADDYLKNNPKTVGDAIEEALKYSLENLI
jgi:hypothetical protein